MMAQSQFRLSLAKFAAKAGDRADTVMRVCALEMLSRVVQRTPVDTGRARGNWQTSIGAPVSGVVGTLDKTGEKAQAAGQRAVAGYSVGPSIWLTNNLPYAQRLEYGYSSQAPAGMVRVTVREFKGIIGASVAQAKRAHP